MKKIGFELDSNLSLDEIKDELLNYRKRGIYAFCIYNGTKVENDIEEEKIVNLIEMLKLNMNEKEYFSYTVWKERENYINQIIRRKMSTNAFTRFWIDSVCSYLPDKLKGEWEYECYKHLLNEFITEDAIRIVGFIITALFEEQDDNKILDKIRLAFLLNNNEIADITYFLKRYAPRQDLLKKYVYYYTDSLIPRDYNFQNEFDKFFSLVYPNGYRGDKRSK